MFHIAMSRTTAVLTAATILLLSACGGGAVATLLAEVGSGGTGARVLGTLSGFGSLIVDGMRRDDAMASYLSEEDQGLAVPMASTGMMLGHSLEFGVDADNSITSVMVSPELVGTVTATSASSITVLGTEVKWNRDTASGPVTVLTGYATPAAIQVGDRVAVYGLLKTDSAGVAWVQASLVVQKPVGTGVRLTGYVTQYNAAAGSFVIGTQTILTTSATVSPAGVPLANGMLVTLWSNTPAIGNVITANTLRVKWPAGSGNLTLAGAVTNYAGAASFKIRNVAIDAGTATLLPSGASLSDNAYVVAVGKYDAATNKLTATSITVYAPAASAAVELHGTVLNFVSSASFTVRGVVVDVSAASITGGTLADIGNGAFVEVFGAVTNNLVKATAVRIVSVNPLAAPGGAMLDLAGTITSYDGVTGNYTMTMASGAVLSGTANPTTFYNNGAAANMAIGQAVNVRGLMKNNQLATSVVNFTQATFAPGSGIAHLEGVAYNVTANSFMLNGLTIQLNGVPVQGGGMMGGRGSMSGVRIGVDVQYSAGQYMATAIRLQNGG